MKTLYYVPMIHSKEEFGSLKDRIMQVQAEFYGKDGLDALLEEIDEYWDLVGSRIAEAGFFSPKASTLHIFVDGLPNSNKAVVDKIVEELTASRRIPAYRIIKRLQKYGATVHGTEDLSLLLEEYQYVKNLADGRNTDADTATAQNRLNARDIAIARRIEEVMKNDGDVGMLFIGRMHDVIGKLSDEFTVINL